MKIFRNTISIAVVIATLITLLPPLSRNASATAIEHYENYGTMYSLWIPPMSPSTVSAWICPIILGRDLITLMARYMSPWRVRIP